MNARVAVTALLAACAATAGCGEQTTAETVIRANTPAGELALIADDRPAAGVMPAMTNGKEVFDRWCWGCHEPLPGRFGITDPPAGTYRLQLRYNGVVPAALEERTDLTPELIRTVVRKGLNMMPPARKTEISDAQLEDVVMYLTQKK